MRIALACLAVGLMGWLAGAALSRWEYTRNTVDLGPLGWDPDAQPQTLSPPEHAPQAVVVGGTEYDFGTMPRGTSKSHAFVIRNEGNRPLVLSIAETTCQCTVGQLDRAEVPPGEETRVTLTWSAEGFDRQFRQSATLRTNDPRQPSVMLSVAGQIRQMVRPEPSSLVLSQISRNETNEAHLRVYGYDEQPLELRQASFANPATAEYFEASVEPLSGEQLEREPEARSGLDVTVRVLPGLPLGPVRQELVLDLANAETAPLRIAIQASVISDVSILPAPDFLRERNLVQLGRVDQNEGKSITLHVLVKGPHPDQIGLSVGDVDPADVLQAELGPARQVGEGKSLIYPLEIAVKPGARPVSRLGSQQGETGSVALRMSGTDADELLLRVAFVVLGR